MPIPRKKDSRGSTGAADFWYGLGRISYPTIRQVRNQSGGAVGITTELSEVVGSNVTQSFSTATGATPQSSPESRITVDLPTLALVVYVGGFWYDANNPLGNPAAKVYRRITVDGSEIGPTKGLFYTVANGKGFESVVDDELFFAEVHEVMLLEAGSHNIEHQIWVENASSLVSNFEFKFSDRWWSAYGFFAQEVAQ